MACGFDYDGEMRCYQPRLREALAVEPDDVVLDIGCGTGTTTREAARLAIRGSAVGVDVSPERLALARRDAPANVSFVRADAQVHPFPPARFTLAFSRYGTMFFADPAAAFANIGRALRPGARFVQLVWQGSARQEWVSEIRGALAAGAPVAGDESAFSLGDPAVVTELLTTAGFTGIDVTDLAEPIWYGADPDAAVDAVLPLRLTRDVLDQLSGTDRDLALDRLRSVMVAHHTPDGVWFGSRSWLVTARGGGG
ncbi:class I SAM-dependent methyltransferase [Amycolatopsis sp. NPDC051903]|uniref:class I SAM-dependent methyltransferase n=1 Tax=Amycolatopsis sp. NPDC051903 TaxID=3363936 RepID=UPI00379D3F63